MADGPSAAGSTGEEDRIVLAVGETMTCSIVVDNPSAADGQHTNTATVTAVGPTMIDSSGGPVDGVEVTDSDKANARATGPVAPPTTAGPTPTTQPVLRTAVDSHDAAIADDAASAEDRRAGSS